MNDKGANWSLDQHLSAGASALIRIAQADPDILVQPTCHHFSERVPLDPVLNSITEAFARLVPTFANERLEFLPDRLEAWEQVGPSAEWLERRVPNLYHLAAKVGLRYQGWTWEPSGSSPVGAIDFELINHRTE